MMVTTCGYMYRLIDGRIPSCHNKAIIFRWREDDGFMKQRMRALAAIFCLVLALTACGGGDASPDGEESQNEAAAPMTEEEYQSEVDALSGDIGTAMTSLSGLTATDEDAFREGIAAIRAMVEPFRDFAAISNPPEAWAEAHAKIAEGCSGFADALEGLCDSAEGLLDQEVTPEDYSSAVTEHTAGLTEAAALLTEGFGMIEGA